MGCFPTADRVVIPRDRRTGRAGDGSVFIMYEYELKTGERHRNTEFTIIRNGQLAETQVFFGGRV